MLAGEVIAVSDQLNDGYDVVVAGGGPAGLNGALMLARSRRSVVVIDAGAPRNAPATGVHGLIGREGTSPAELLERGRAEVRSYGGHVFTGEGTPAAPRHARRQGAPADRRQAPPRARPGLPRLEP